MNDDITDAITVYLSACGIDYDIISQIKAILMQPTPNVAQEVIDFLKEKHVDRTIILVIWDMIITHIERGNSLCSE